MELITVPIEMIIVKNNIRKDMDLCDMERSILDRGIIQPIIVKRHEGKYRIVSGHRRFAALKNSGDKRVSCIVSNITEAEIPYYQLIENIQRKDLTLDELIAAFDAIKNSEDIKIGDAEIADFLGKPGDWIRRKRKSLRSKTGAPSERI